MVAITEAITKLAEAKGVQFITGMNCEEIMQSAGKVSGVRLSNGEVIATDNIIFNGDAMALQTGLLGLANQSASPALCMISSQFMPVMNCTPLASANYVMASVMATMPPCTAQTPCISTSAISMRVAGACEGDEPQ